MKKPQNGDEQQTDNSRRQTQFGSLNSATALEQSTDDDEGNIPKIVVSFTIPITTVVEPQLK